MTNQTSPLLPIDPPRIGPYWPRARLLATAAGVAYIAQHPDRSAPEMLLLLSQGAAGDAAARDRLAGEVAHLDIDTVRAFSGLSLPTSAETAKAEFVESAGPEAAPKGWPALTAPWVALAYDHSPAAITEAKRLFQAVDLSANLELGEATGPRFALPWVSHSNPAIDRVWPLPWPGRRSRSGRLTIMSAWLLMLLLAAVGVLIAILIFSQAPVTQPPPPIPTQQPSNGGASGSPSSGTPSSGTPSSGEGSSSSSASPSSGDSGSASASPSPSDSGSGSSSASPSPSNSGGGGSGSNSAGASPTPISRL
ncbi:MAG: hypothetical protein LBV30_10745 [Propionibacteriaceae bacterium]|nr:hypothetical protein [Propionibacteriaceae bacterium]